ncbi:hypothetical protein AAFF_G00296840 [Aldrovandia affinis]|uniref:Uncharacterized protein n=1 Tax=Aldrovandia affinis TaxID=143900 RepID=A0AAD7WRW8_9TELE|nr:hypothetical protein AAFF_G00296840 [Aldrovandia affinis]
MAVYPPDSSGMWCDLWRDFALAHAFPLPEIAPSPSYVPRGFRDIVATSPCRDCSVVRVGEGRRIVRLSVASTLPSVKRVIQALVFSPYPAHAAKEAFQNGAAPLSERCSTPALSSNAAD